MDFENSSYCSAADDFAAQKCKKVIDRLDKQARIEGERKYATGPGKRRRHDFSSLPEGSPIYRREKKTRSAYISRFKAKAFENLLEKQLTCSENEKKRIVTELAAEQAENRSLRAKIALLESSLSAQTVKNIKCENECPSSAETSSYISGADSSLSVVSEDYSCPEDDDWSQPGVQGTACSKDTAEKIMFDLDYSLEEIRVAESSVPHGVECGPFGQWLQ